MRSGVRSLAALLPVVIAACNALFGVDDLAYGEPRCLSVTDCPAPDSSCLMVTCEAGNCGEAALAANTTCDELGGYECDGEGNCVKRSTALQHRRGVCGRLLCGQRVLRHRVQRRLYELRSGRK